MNATINTTTSVAHLCALLLLVGGACGPHKGETHPTEASSGDSESHGTETTATATSPDPTTASTGITDASSNGTSATGPGDSETQGGDPSWAFGGWYHAQEDHGEISTYIVYKYQIFGDGTSRQVRLFCGGESMYSGVWHAVDEDTIRIEPNEGEDAVSTPGGTNVMAIEISRGETCGEAQIVSFWKDMTPSMPGTYTQGDMCLVCSNDGIDQLQWCEGGAPPPCE